MKNKTAQKILRECFIGVTLFLGACGTQPAQDPNALNSKDPNKDTIQTQPDKKQTVVQYRKDGTNYSLMVADSKDLPTCDLSNEKQLAYVKNENKFFSCQESTWTEVSIKGSDGAQGPTGPQGPKGDPASPVPTNQWYDPIGKVYYLIGGNQTFYLAANPDNVTAITPSCINGWRLPTLAEAHTAQAHGIGTASSSMNGPTDMWASDNRSVVNGVSYAYTLQFNSGLEIGKPFSESHGTICIQVQQ